MKNLVKKLAAVAIITSAANADTIGVSLPFQTEFLAQIAPSAKSALLVPVGADPHSFEPRASTMRALQDARLYLALGVESEELWLPKIRSGKTAIVRVDASVPKREYALNSEHSEHHVHEAHDHHSHEHSHEHHDHSHHHSHEAHEHEHHDHHLHDHSHHHHGTDVHIWTSPRNLSLIADASAAALSEHSLDVDAAALAALKERLKQADKTIFEALQGLKIRGFVSAHPSWGYFAADYDLREFSLEFEGKQASPKELAQIKQLAADGKVCVILSAPQFSDKYVKVLQKETNLPVVQIDPLVPKIIDELEKFAGILSKYCR